MPPLNLLVHAFYYPWYGNPEFNGKYLHWAHEVFPDWRKPARPGRRPVPAKAYAPPADIGSSYWPQLGAYSSRDPAVLRSHMAQLVRAEVGVIAVSWYPPSKNDGQIQGPLSYTDQLMPLVLDAAAEAGVAVCIHMEPYPSRTAESLSADIRHAIDAYGAHPAFYRHAGRPVFYAYDSYQVSSQQWAQVLRGTSSRHSIRGGKYDSIVIGLLLGDATQQHILQSGFDGLYTYFAAAKFTEASSPSKWGRIVDWARANDLLASISIGPGYNDECIRPWNSENSHDRAGGDYYSSLFSAAIRAKPDFISITSFNEWHEGTQIEASIPRTRADGSTYPYLDYLPHEPGHYLDLTREWSQKFKG